MLSAVTNTSIYRMFLFILLVSVLGCQTAQSTPPATDINVIATVTEQPTPPATDINVIATVTEQPTPTPTDIPTDTPSPSPTRTNTPERQFSASVKVSLSTTSLVVGETITVTASVENRSTNCTFSVMDYSLSQDSDPPLLDPIGIDQSKSRSFELTAVRPGTVTVSVYAYGEHNCGYSQTDFYWAGAGGTSEPISIKSSK